MCSTQVLTQQVERVNDLESEIKEKEHLLKTAEVDLIETKEAYKKDKENIKEKEKALDCVIISQKKSVEESKLIEELKLTKELLTKAQRS